MLDGLKSLEIRGQRSNKHAGECVYLALSGAGLLVLGSIEFVACNGPLGPSEWEVRAAEYCMSGAALPYSTTYA